MSRLRTIDLNLLLVLRTLLSEHNLTRAGRRLSMTQPAVSNCLKRLRLILKDELFVRDSGSMRPTERALELQPLLESFFESIEHALWPQRFNPTLTQRRFRLAFSDEAVVIIVPELSERLAHKAPGFDLRIEPKAVPATSAQMMRKQVDLAVGLFDDLPEQIDSQVLFEERHVCLVRKGHPLAAGEMNLQALVNHDHLRLRSSASESANLDLMLRNKGLRRKTVISLNQCHVVPSILRRTNLVCCMLEWLADAVLENVEDIVKRVVPLPSIPVKLIWHRGSHQDEALSWLRGEIVDICSEINLSNIHSPAM